MSVALIAAAAGKDLVIGRDGDLPWHFASDLKFFKEKTMGHPVLMGRVTYQSILKRLGKPLPGRTNIVLSRDPTFQDARVTVIHDASEISPLEHGKEKLFVIGGATLFAETISTADEIYMTHIDQEIEGDTYFPPIDDKFWSCIEEQKTAENGVTLRFCLYRRKASSLKQ